jgi:hypothetical protein
MTDNKTEKGSKVEPVDQAVSRQIPGNRFKTSEARAGFRSGYRGTSSHYQIRLPVGEGFLSKTHPAVRPILEAATDLKSFRDRAGELLLSERRLIVDQALVLLEQNYVHLPLKKAIHAVDPVQRLKLLKFRLSEMTSETMMDELQFHDEMLEIFTSVRDYHTRYTLPSPYNNSTAFLPFLVEEYFNQEDERRFIVTHVVKEFDKPHFKSGVEILHWNGIPIKRAIELNGENQQGSNPDARFACGLDALTIRPLMSSLPPDEEWVTINYLTLQGEELELRQKWLVIPSGTFESDLRAATLARKGNTKLSIFFQKADINKVRTVLFAPQAIAAQNKIAAGKVKYSHVKKNEIENKMPDIFRARQVQTTDGVFAYIRIFTFVPLDGDVDAFVEEFKRLLGVLPQNGLIIDVRSNGGGAVEAGERLLQFLTPEEIEPETFEFINTPLNLAMCRVAPEEEDLLRWSESIAQSVLTGATYSVGFPLTLVEDCNNTGQIYKGPVVLITDALCYSATDIFAAGFQDHGIGMILGTSGSTGAGGANVWGHENLLSLLGGRRNSPLEELPKDVGLCVAIRRSRRIGERAGTPLEEFGVTANEVHKMTRRDVLQSNIDLINHAAEILSRLSIKLTITRDGELTVIVRTENVSRVEFIINKENKSLDVQDGKVQFSASISPFVLSILRLRGFELAPDGEHLVAVRNIGVHPNPDIFSLKGALEMVSKSKKGGGGAKKSKKGASKTDLASKSGGGGTTSNKSGPGSTKTSKKPSKKGSS